VIAMQDRIMFVEYKGLNSLAGTARITRLQFSQTGKSVYYRKRLLQSVKSGYKYNHVNTETGERYWISGPKKKGDDTLYPGIIHIDEDVREDYWLKIREEPERVNESSFRSEGKYSKRRPR